MIATIKNPETGKMDMMIILDSNGAICVGRRAWGGAVSFVSREEAVDAIKKSIGNYQSTDKNNLVMDDNTLTRRTK
jgi:hypothetical protein